MPENLEKIHYYFQKTQKNIFGSKMEDIRVEFCQMKKKGFLDI